MPRLSLLRRAPLAALALLAGGCFRRETPAEAGIRTQTLLLGNAGEPQDLDPSAVTEWWDSNIDNALFEGLTWIDETTTKPIPALATGWDVSPDGLVYTFHLRPGVRWSNGDPLTAGDFVYAFHRELSPKFAANYSYMLWPIRNAEAFNSGKLTDFDLVGVKAVDAVTLRIELARPTPYLPALAAHNTWFPVDRACIEKFGAMDQRATRWTLPGNLVGNGPFVLTEWIPNSRIVVVKNPNYWDAARVRLNKIVFFPIENPDSEELSFRSGQLHATYGLPVSRIARYRKDHPDQLRLEDNLGTFYLLINTRKPPFDNRKLRRALALAVDRNRIARDICLGTRTPAHSFVPPHCGGYTSLAQIPDDFEAAARLLAQAGYPGGAGLPTVEVEIFANDTSLRTLEAIQADWKNRLGFHITITPVEAKTLYANQQAGNYTISFAGWIADYPDPSTFLDIMEGGNGNNWSGYKSPVYDRLIEAAARESDNSRRFEDFQEAEARLLDDAPLIPLFFGERPQLVQPYVRGYLPSALGYKRFKNVWLER